MPENKPQQSKKMSPAEREKALLLKIEKAKQSLMDLQSRRKKAIGELAYKCGLQDVSDEVLRDAFLKLAKEQGGVTA